MQRQHHEEEKKEKKKFKFGMTDDDVALIKSALATTGWQIIRTKLLPKLRDEKINILLNLNSNERADNIMKGEIKMICEFQNILRIIEETN